MEILITRGTGFVGKQVVRTALEKGHKVRCLVRDGEKAKKIFNADSINGRIKFFEGDIQAKDSIITSMEGVDAVIHLVGIIIEIKKWGVTFEKVHFEGTKNLVDACKTSDVSRYIHMSALGTGPEAMSRYHSTKWKAEEYVRKSGLEYTIFRPSIIFGREDDFVNRFARMINMLPIVPILGSGKTLMQPISVTDVADFFIQSLENQRSYNKTYEIGGPEQISLEGIIDRIMEVLHKKRFKIHIPLSLAGINATIMEKVMTKPMLTREQLAMLQKDNVCDTAPSLQDFNIELTDFTEGIREYLVKELDRKDDFPPRLGP